MDLVHPSLHCYVHGYSRIAAAEGNSVTPPISPPVSSLADHRAARMRQERDVNRSAKFQWLPSDVTVAGTGHVTIDSYVNNLHPELHSGLYDTLGVLIGAFVPLWSAVLTEAVSVPKPRVAVEMYDLWEPFEYPSDEEGAVEDDVYYAYVDNRQMVNGPTFDVWDASREVQHVDLCGRQLQVTCSQPWYLEKLENWSLYISA